jgi:hypothetical protein
LSTPVIAPVYSTAFGLVRAARPPASLNPEGIRPSVRECVFRARRIVAAAVVAVVGALWATPAVADPPRFETLPTVGAFGAVTLNGIAQLTTATVSPFIIADDSGTLAGWNVTLTVPQFANGTGVDCTTDATATIPATSVAMNAAVVAPADGLTVMTGVSSAAFADFTAPRKIIVATVGNGAGRYAVTPALLRFEIPEYVRPGTYCTQATIAITSGP